MHSISRFSEKVLEKRPISHLERPYLAALNELDRLRFHARTGLSWSFMAQSEKPIFSSRCGEFCPTSTRAAGFRKTVRATDWKAVGETTLGTTSNTEIPMARLPQGATVRSA